MPVLSSGSSSFKSPFNSKITLGLNKILLVPNLTKNLISVSKFAQDNRVFFEFHAFRCVVKSQDTKEVLLYGTVQLDGLYEFTDILSPAPKDSSESSPSVQFATSGVVSASSGTVPPTTATTSASSPSSNTVNNTLSCKSAFDWHLRLGHPNPHSLKLVMTHCNIPISNKDVSLFCSACCMGKSHMLHAP